MKRQAVQAFFLVSKTYFFGALELERENALGVEGETDGVQMGDLDVSVVFAAFIGPVLVTFDLKWSAIVVRSK